VRLSALVYRLKKTSSCHLRGEFRPIKLRLQRYCSSLAPGQMALAACSPQCIKLWTARYKQKFAENGPFCSTRRAIRGLRNALVAATEAITEASGTARSKMSKP
jgi:hypothetical protein